MSLHVIFVRHGETLWHAENRYAGSTDIALTERGHAQSRALADWAEQADLTAIFASPLTRSQETARDSAVSTGLPVSVDERLRELDFGIAEGLTRAEMQQRFPDHLSAFQTDPVTNHFPKGRTPWPPATAIWSSSPTSRPNTAKAASSSWATPPRSGSRSAAYSACLCASTAGPSRSWPTAP